MEMEIKFKRNNDDDEEQIKCDNRRKAHKEFVKQKSGKSRIKAWFYGVDKDFYYESFYDHLRYKAVCKKLNNYEKKGVTVRREYLTSYDKEKLGKVTYKLYAKKNWDISYRPFCWRWVKDIFWNVSNQLKYNEHVCSWDYYDIQSYLIVNLTIKGLFLGLYGHGLYHKKQMHEVWEVRSKLIKAFNYEDYFDYYVVQKALMKGYGLKKNICFYNKERFLEFGEYGDLFKMGAGKPFTCAQVDLGELQVKFPMKKNENENSYRERILEKSAEIDDYLKKFEYTKDSCIRYKEQQEMMKEAFSLLGERLFGMWD